MEKMVIVPRQSGFEEEYSRAYEYTSTLSSVGAGPAVAIPSGVQSVQVQIRPSAASSGRVEFTLDTVASVEADTATWHSWPWGDVTSVVTDSVMPVTALRLHVVSGSVAISMRAQ